MNPFTSPTQNRMIARSVGTVTTAGILSLMAAMPALAADPYFTLKFESTASSSTNGGINGILGEATYTFSEINLGEMTLSLKNLSGSPVTGSRLVSTGFDLPTNPPASANVNFVSFSKIDPNWNIVYPGTAVPPFPAFDVCTSVYSTTPPNPADCDASGSPTLGLQNGSSTTVGTFTLSSAPTLDTATKYRDAFVAMFQAPPSGGTAGTFDDGGYFMRFNDILPASTGGSDKIWATSITTGGGQAPGDSVPGPLPLFGAAAAFGYSRKLRRRMKANSMVG